MLTPHPTYRNKTCEKYLKPRFLHIISMKPFITNAIMLVNSEFKVKYEWLGFNFVQWFFHCPIQPGGSSLTSMVPPFKFIFHKKWSKTNANIVARLKSRKKFTYKDIYTNEGLEYWVHWKVWNEETLSVVYHHHHTRSAKIEDCFKMHDA